jgi:hypothetical protein
VKINLRKYKLERIDGKFEKTPIFESKFKTWIKSVVLYCFRKINYRHVNLKNHNDKPMINEILDIRGIRTCAYENSSGRVIIAEFMWKFGKFYI